MVSVRLTVLPVSSEDTRPLRSTVSNKALSERNSTAHTPTVNAGAALAVSDTILQFLSTLRPYSEPVFDAVSNDPSNGSYGGETGDAQRLLPSPDSFALPNALAQDEPEANTAAERTGRRPHSSRDIETEHAKHSENTAASALLEMITNAEQVSFANETLATNQRTSDDLLNRDYGRTPRSVLDNFAISQASIARLFGLSPDDKSTSDRKSGAAQNDNRASARYQQQSPDSWSNVANIGQPHFAANGSISGEDRRQILRTKFTEAGTYQFG